MKDDFFIEDGLPNRSHWSWNVKEKGKPIIAVDFDHTITDGCPICSGDVIDIQDNVVDIMKELHRDFKIVIYTGYDEEVWRGRIERYLKKNGIPFDEIVLGKPQACFIIDDRAIHHKSWIETLAEINKRR